MLLIGVAGTELTAQERDWLQHDAVAGVVLFKRNFASRQQVTDLSAAIRAAAPRPQLICRAAAAAGDRGAVRDRSAAGAGAGRAARLADGQRGARQRCGPQLRAGGRPRPWQPRHRQPRLQ
ncbi:hypothetical protein G6F32_014972 [Rhizopus arrhizus]|nr:hypothetical protein G6F32_014972 [Rhizopus arrhizus]